MAIMGIKQIAVLAAASAMAMAAPAMAVTFTGSGPGSYSASTADNVATFNFAYDGYGNGAGDVEWTFQTVADRTGNYSFNFNVDGYSAYFIAGANASAFSAGNSQALYNTSTFGGYNQSGTFSLDLIEGQSYGIQVGGRNFDSDSRVQGTFTLTGDAIATAGAVPEPASWAMMILGMGAVGGALRRRSKVSTKVTFA
jgi:hypothetical protein